jgi:hypothetical protein
MKFLTPILIVTAVWLSPVALANQVASTTTAQCARLCLAGMLNNYFAALQSHDTSLLHTTSDVIATENGAPADPGASRLWQVGAIATYRLDAIDPVSSQAASDAVVTTGDTSAILFVRLRVTRGKIDQIETVLVRQGEGQRSNPDGLSGRPALYEETIDPAKRASREQLVGAAKAYFQGIANAGTGAYVSPPLAADATRVENGVAPGLLAVSASRPRLTIDEQLRHGFGSDKLYVSEQRFPVIDQERGIVLGIGLMHVDRPDGVALNPALKSAHAVDSPHLRQILVEFFKIQGGLIRQIQATMYDLNSADTTSTGWQ